MSAFADAVEEGAIALASADDPELLDLLRATLTTRDGLDLLDDPRSLLGPSSQLRLAAVLDVMTENPAAHALLAELTTDPVFGAAPARREALIGALALVPEPDRRTLDYWERHTRAGEGYVNLTVAALFINRSAPALALFTRLMQDGSHDLASRALWAHRYLLAHRDQPPVIARCAELIGAELPPELQQAVVEAVLDHQPDAWFGPDGGPEPASIAPRDEEGRARLTEFLVATLALPSLRDDLRQRAHALLAAHEPPS